MSSNKTPNHDAETVLHARLGLQCPSRVIWIAFAKYIVLIQLLWLVVYGGADWVAASHSYRVRLHLDFELGIPLIPASSIVYLSLFPLLWLSPFVLHTTMLLHGFAKALASLIVLSGIGFLVLPSQPAYELSEATGPFAEIFHFMDSVNLSHNMCPSLHVGMAAVCAYFYSCVLARKYAVVICIWAFAIALSTLFAHEHHLVDVIAGGIVGYLIAKFVFLRMP